jgi:REP element-mobilizing transposase RayT
MPRAPRIQEPNVIYHVNARAARRSFLFPSAGERDLFEDVLMIALPRAQVECHSYCVMGSHYHLLLRPTLPNLAEAMKRLNWLYAWRFNRLFGFKGHCFESRYWSRPVRTSEQLITAVRYLALNPVRAGLCDSPLAWPWSSYAALVGLAPAPEFLTVDLVLGEFGATPAAARATIRRLVEEPDLAAA